MDISQLIAGGFRECADMECDTSIMYVHGWENCNRKCSKCATTSSVKYDRDGEQYCNICVLLLAKRSE